MQGQLPMIDKKNFMNQIGQNMKVCIDKILVKSYILQNHVKDFEKTFTTLYRY